MGNACLFGSFYKYEPKTSFKIAFSDVKLISFGSDKIADKEFLTRFLFATKFVGIYLAQFIQRFFSANVSNLFHPLCR